MWAVDSSGGCVCHWCAAAVVGNVFIIVRFWCIYSLLCFFKLNTQKNINKFCNHLTEDTVVFEIAFIGY